MSFYTVTLPDSAKSLLHNGVDRMVVEANSAAQAKVLAEAQSSLEPHAPWANATVVEQTQNLVGTVFTITVDPAGTPVVFAYTAEDGDTWEDVAEALEVLCEVSYTSSWAKDSTHGLHGTLVIATGSGTDDLGDKAVTATAIGPNGEDLSAKFFGNIVDEGSSTDDLSVDCLSICPSLRVIGAYKG